MKAKFILIISFLFIPSIHLLAAEPPAEDVGAQAERFKIGVEQKKEELEPKELKAPEIEIKPVEEKAVTEGISFTLKEVVITGTTVFKPEDFRPIYEPSLGKKVTFKDLELIVEKIKAKYTQKGYLTTIVYLPEQDIAEGKIEIKVVEGKMGKLSIEGNKYFSSSLIEKYFHLKKNEILNVKRLQKDILRLNQNPDLEVKAVIAAGEEPETSDLTLKIKDKFPWHLGVSEDNQGTRLVGKYRSSVWLRSTNATDNFDSLFINTLFSCRSFGESVSYSIPLNTYGTKFTIEATYFKMKLGKEYGSFDITGKSQIYTPYISWELALLENYQANANIGLEIKSIEKKTAGSVTANDELRLPYFSFDFTKLDSFGQTVFSPKFNFSTEDFWGASNRNHPTASRVGSGGFFFKYAQTLRRTQRMPFKSYLQLRSQFQAASHTLPSSEQFQLGGANSIRGYPEGDYVCDMGGNLDLDWVFPLSFIPLRNQIEWVVFADSGGGKLKKVLPGEKGNKFLAGVGAGLRCRLNNKFSLRLEWAEHLADRPTSGSGPSTFYLTFQSEM